MNNSFEGEEVSLLKVRDRFNQNGAVGGSEHLELRTGTFEMYTTDILSRIFKMIENIRPSQLKLAHASAYFDQVLNGNFAKYS